MVKQYYYTVASLPSLKFDEESPISQEEFAEICAVELSGEDLRYVEQASIRLTGENAAVSGESPEDPPGVLREWNRMLREFQQQAGLIRAGSLGWEVERMPRPDVEDAAIPERLRQIANEDNPLKQELAILRYLFEAAESREPGHHFDRETLALYHLKLQVVLRRARISDADAGNEEFDRQYETVAASLMEIAT